VHITTYILLEEKCGEHTLQCDNEHTFMVKECFYTLDSCSEHKRVRNFSSEYKDYCPLKCDNVQLFT
jgi:hypothetical protein